MRISKLVLVPVLIFFACSSSAQDANGPDALLFGHDIGWIKIINATGINIEVSDQVRDGCWTNISAVQNAVELQLIRSGYETYTGDDQKPFSPTIYLGAMGFSIAAVNGCAVAIELSVFVPELGSVESDEGVLKSFYAYEVAGYTGMFTARKSNSNDSIKAQFEDLVQTLLVDAQKNRQNIRKALTEHRETPVTRYWLRQLE